MNYSEKVLEHFNNPRNVGELADADGVGTVGNAKCGDIMQVYIKVKDNVITDSSFKTFGCGAAVATSSMATELIKGTIPGMHNQAIMEFGALQCVPANPQCGNCPVFWHCQALKDKMVNQIPAKQSKTKVRERFFYYLIIKEGKNVFLNKRPSGDIWEGLYDFPLIETEKQIELHELMKNHSWQLFFGDKSIHIKQISSLVKHILSHQRLNVHFINIEAGNLLTNYPDNWIRINADTIHGIAVPRLIDRYIHSNDFNKLFADCT